MSLPNRPAPPGLLSKKDKANKNTNKGGIFGGIANSGGGILNPSGTAGTLAELIEKQAANQKRQAEANNPTLGMNPLELLQQQLFGAVNGIDVAPTPLETLRQMAQAQVAAQFDPQIAALKSEMGVHSNRAQKSANTARDMYGSLSQDYLSQLPGLTAQFKAEDDAANSRYDQAQQQMQGEYAKQAADQEAVLKRLGVEAALPESSQQARDDQAYFQNQMEMDQQSAVNALNEQQMAQQSYTRNLGNSAKMAGENTAQDIRSQLEDYLTQAGGQLASLNGQRGAAIEALVSQMQAQDAQRVEQQRQQEFDNQLKLFNFQLSAQKAMQDTEGKNMSPFGGGGSGLTTGLPGAQNYLASQYPNQPIMASNLMELLNNVLSDQNVTNGKFILDPGNPSMGKSPKYSDVGQQYMEDLLRRQFEMQGDRYNNGDMNATLAALEAYLGKLR